MTNGEILTRLRDIANHVSDFEQAHAMEDELYENVLREIAEGEIDRDAMTMLAILALKSKKIKFNRVCS